MKKHFVLFFVIFILFSSKIFSLDFTGISTAMTTVFSNITSDSDGRTSYRSLLIPPGGRSESLGNAFTGLCDDASYINFNAGASCIQKQTLLSVFHNAWISDSKMETISYTSRNNHFGIGGLLSCFYVPFTEYNMSGERVATGYYSETTAAINASYNFLAGYDFKGFALGTSIKTCWRGVPDYTDNDTNAIIKGSGFSQSGIAIMADFGLVLQFNFLKYFASREPNVRIGFAAQNFGVGFTGIGSDFQIDDPLPTYVAAGMSVKFFPFLTVTADIKQPLNLLNIGEYNIFSFNVGGDFTFSNNFSLLFGIEIKGGNPRLSAGGQAEFNNTRVNLNYTLDLTSSVSPINRISLSAQMLLGDRGRAKAQKEIDVLYNKGLVYYYSSDWDNAISTWEKVLEIDKRYDPAILGIESAKSQKEMIIKVRESMFFEE